MKRHAFSREFEAIAGLAVLLVSLAVHARAEEKVPALDLSRLPAATEKPVDFKKDVYPILLANCFKCHQGSDASSEVRLDVRAVLLGPDGKGSLAKPGLSGQSRLIHLVSGILDDEKMPPEGKGRPLSAAQVGVLRAWIDQGLKWDEKLLPPPEAARNHWAFQPILAPVVPTVDRADWVRTPVDAFVAATHARHGLSPAPEASRQTHLSRLSLDLTGLPPTPAEAAEFLADDSPAAYERLVERLLASPHYGERWGRHWLDLARWADTEGYESNHPRPYAWRYRDWVVNSFNADLPYDRFLRAQLAGDEMLPYSDENLVATGFLSAARLSSNEEDKALQRNDVLVDITNATASTVLGLTFACAQCHSHKFDPLTHQDYYRFQAFFAKGQPNNLALKDPSLWTQYEAAKPPEYDPAVELRSALESNGRQRLIAETKKKLDPEMVAALDTPDDMRSERMRELARQADLKFQFNQGQIVKALGDEDQKLFEALNKKLDSLKGKIPDKPQTWGFYSPASSPTAVDVLPSIGFYPLPYEPRNLKATKSYVLLRGEVHQRGAEVLPGWPAVLGEVSAEQASRIEKTPRMALADWLCDQANPLTSRVWVNRLWHYHFGRGLVATTGDFGVKGAAPSDPQLLDWLAAELMNHGWSTKHIHRQIVLSSTYRQSSAVHEANARIDPENQYLWHWSPRRLEAEAIRDSLLVASGELDRTMGGASLPPDKADAGPRRTLYLLQKRDAFPEVQALFDGPTSNESCTQRYVSTVALQPLYLLNHEFIVKRARKMAARVMTEVGSDRTGQVELAFQIALGRLPNPADRRAAEAFFAAPSSIALSEPAKTVVVEKEPPASDATQASGTPASAAEPPLALIHFCHALLNLNEFIYLE